MPEIILTCHQRSKKRKGICIDKGCRNKAAKQNNSCHAHIKRRYAEKYPVKYAFQTLRNNAKRRGKEFTITLDQFREFCAKTKILLGRGIQKDSLHIDRIDESGGYSIDNIQVLTNSENVKKIRHYDYLTKTGYTSLIKNENIDNCPF